MVLMELLEHDDPSLLQRVLGDVVGTGNTSREWQEPAGAASDPLLKMAFQERALDCLGERCARLVQVRLPRYGTGFTAMSRDGAKARSGHTPCVRRHGGTM